MLNIDVDIENAEEKKNTITIGLSVIEGTLVVIVLTAIAIVIW